MTCPLVRSLLFALLSLGVGLSSSTAQDTAAPGNADGEQLVRQLTERRHPWLLPPGPELKSLRYTYHLRGDERVVELAPATKGVRFGMWQGATLSTGLRALAASPEKFHATARRIESDPTYAVPFLRLTVRRHEPSHALDRRRIRRRSQFARRRKSVQPGVWPQQLERCRWFIVDGADRRGAHRNHQHDVDHARVRVGQRSHDRTQPLQSVLPEQRRFDHELPQRGAGHQRRGTGRGELSADLWLRCDRNAVENGAAIDLNTLLPVGSGWNLLSAEGINNAGDIVGYGTFGGQTRGFLRTAVPEPASGLLLACAGLAGLFLRRL
jgi:hypothetical protein